MTSPIRRAHRSRTLDMPQYLIVADESSLTELEAGLATLPLCARGRVFVEVQNGSQIEFLDVPPRMVVTWFVREGLLATTDAGVKIGRAVTAWASEMLCDEDARAQAWLLGSPDTIAPVRDMLRESELPDSAVMTAEAFRL